MEDDRTVTVRIPLVFKKHGGRKTVISTDGIHVPPALSQGDAAPTPLNDASSRIAREARP